MVRDRKSGLLLLSGRREHFVKCQLKGIIQHSRQQHRKKGRRLLNTRISIDLDEPELGIFVKHEVVTEDLETIKSLETIYFFLSALGCHNHYLLHTFYITASLLIMSVKLYPYFVMMSSRYLKDSWLPASCLL